MRTVNAFLLPTLAEPERLCGQTVVVIDVLRATTTIAVALANGAARVVPCLEVEDARKAVAELRGEQALAGGERGGLPIPGFDLGNSPREFGPEIVAGKTIVFTTTNGTRAMQQCHLAARVLLAAFVNAGAVLKRLASEPSASIVCAGTRGEITREDTLLAGYLCHALGQAGATMNDEALIACDAWRAVAARAGTNEPAPEQLAGELRETQGGRNLKAIGLEGDILDAARLNSIDLAPALDVEKWSIAGR